MNQNTCIYLGVQLDAHCMWHLGKPQFSLPTHHYAELCAMLGAPITDEVLEEHISAVLVNKDLASTSLREEGRGGAWRGIEDHKGS